MLYIGVQYLPGLHCDTWTSRNLRAHGRKETEHVRDGKVTMHPAMQHCLMHIVDVM